MSTRRHKRTKKHYSIKNRTRNNRKGGAKSGKKWVTAIEAAQQTLQKTGSFSAAKKSLKKQALMNARKLFGTVGK